MRFQSSRFRSVFIDHPSGDLGRSTFPRHRIWSIIPAYPRMCRSILIGIRARGSGITAGDCRSAWVHVSGNSLGFSGSKFEPVGAVRRSSSGSRPRGSVLFIFGMSRLPDPRSLRHSAAGRRNRRGIWPDSSHTTVGAIFLQKISRFSSNSLKFRGFLDHGFAIKSIPIYVR